MRHNIFLAGLVVLTSALFTSPIINTSEEPTITKDQVAQVAVVDDEPVQRKSNESPAPKTKTKTKTKPKKKHIKVKRGDTLAKIAKQNKSTVNRLFYANKSIKSPNLISVGQVLRIPTANEKLKRRTIPKPVAKAAPKRTTRRSSTSGTSDRSYGSSNNVWDRLAMCESGGNWGINTGNGYYGGVQFSLATWRGVGGSGYPHQNSKSEQIKRAKILQARSGWGQWPACSKKLGLR